MDWKWLLFLWLLKHVITQSETLSENEPELGWMGIFVSMVYVAYIPTRGLIKGNTTMWIEYGFCSYGYWSISTQSQVSLNKKLQIGLDLTFVSIATGEYSPIRSLIQ